MTTTTKKGIKKNLLHAGFNCYHIKTAGYGLLQLINYANGVLELYILKPYPTFIQDRLDSLKNVLEPFGNFSIMYEVDPYFETPYFVVVLHVHRPTPTPDIMDMGDMCLCTLFDENNKNETMV